MAWPYPKLKRRNQLRALYTQETGKDDYSAREFLEWLIKNGHLEQ